MDNPGKLLKHAFAERLKKVAGEKFSAEALAEDLRGQGVQITGEAIRNLREAKWLPKVEVLYGLARYFNKSMEWFLGKEEPTTSICRIPQREDFAFIGKVTGFLSGGPGSWELSPEIEEYYAFRLDWLKAKGTVSSMKLMEVRGDSMYPTLQSGDYVLIDESQDTPLDGRIMAVMIGKEALCKRIRIEPNNEIILISETEAPRGPYPQNQVTILGKVIWVGRAL